MDYVDELTSGRTPLVKKAAKKILRGRLKGYGPFLHQALEGEMEKPKSWESQMYLLYAMAATDCTEEIPYLKSLLLRDIPTPVTYRSLAVAIAYLENLETENLSFVYESLESNNSSQAAGACAAIYQRKIVLKDIEKLNDMTNLHFSKDLTKYKHFLRKLIAKNITNFNKSKFCSWLFIPLTNLYLGQFFLHD